MCIIHNYFEVWKEILDTFSTFSSNEFCFLNDYNSWASVLNYIFYIRECDV